MKQDAETPGQATSTLSSSLKNSLRRPIRAVTAALVVLACAAGVAACARSNSDSHFYRGYNPDFPLNASIESVEEKEAYRREHFYFDSNAEHRIPALMALPHQDGPHPLIIFVHGVGQSKEFLDEIAEPFVEAGFAKVTFDQYDRGERSLEEAGPIRRTWAMRRRTALTVNEIRRLIDYAQSREDLDHERVYLVGASFGAITGATAAAFEDRIQAAVLTYGGGHLPTLFLSPAVKEEIGFLVYPLRYVAWAFFYPADPIHHVADISPRPILMQNGSEDKLIPPKSAERLYDAAREPKEIIWYEGDHIGLDEEAVEEVIDDSIEWLLKQDERVRNAGKKP
ncbi:MAG: alpha/beta hydrolase family protein [Candidatus Hydrogenedentota bacterium]